MGWRGEVRLGIARRGKAWNMARLGETRRARQGKEHGLNRRGMAGQRVARRGRDTPSPAG